MKVFVAFSCLLALAVARPSAFLTHPVAYHAPLAYSAYAAPVVAAPVAVSSQYHAQDSVGQYNYGYADHLSAKAEAKSFDGVTRGEYSYVDAEGKVQKVEYTADDVHGFQVKASNLPVAPAVPEVAPAAQPEPVKDTAEVAQAKEQHFAAVEEAKARIAAEEATPVAVPVAAPVSYVAPVTTYAAPVTTYAAPAVTAYSHTAYPHAYTHGVYPYSYTPYSNFGYHYTAAAPAYTYAHAGYPVHFAAPALVPAAPATAVAADDDTVEVKAKEE